MIEPPNRTAWVDRGGDTWVRFDDIPRWHGGVWWPLTDGPNWERWARIGVGSPRPWEDVVDHGPLAPADPNRAAAALDRVRQKVPR